MIHCLDRSREALLLYSIIPAAGAVYVQHVLCKRTATPSYLQLDTASMITPCGAHPYGCIATCAQDAALVLRARDGSIKLAQREAAMSTLLQEMPLSRCEQTQQLAASNKNPRQLWQPRPSKAVYAHVVHATAIDKKYLNTWPITHKSEGSAAVPRP